MDRWVGIDEFVAVAVCGSFTGAAEQLDTSVAQVSRRVKALEGTLGYQLLNRTTRKLSLTTEGNVFLSHAKHLQHVLDDATAALRQRDAEPAGKIKITAPVMYGEQYIMPLINKFMSLYPNIQVDMELNNNQLDLIEQGFDFAIRLGNLKDSSLRARLLAHRQTLVCGAPNYLASAPRLETLTDLEHHYCLLGKSSVWRFVAEGKETHFNVKGRLRCNSGWALVNAAEQGLGLVQLPHYYLEEAISNHALVEVLQDFKPESEGVWAVYPPRRFLPTSVRELLEFLAEGLATN
ncbi:LysR family transcriptional regulator [Pseudoalteromonas luteoviolacea]|uniref:LysR family transcriptional regulator n=1 Tax=Pseudoalteromonas luteoviolacea TaxID=43657 RepID=A0A1C0TVH3_9GAMM|nr:LysR family transcriptional regulator [Pseudoalteromonas luteoviolacea]MBQ4809873.1 LysR family transcriptional regulator [Pseudoalteromonas luteoviolacea]OCQ23315.1 LysR family transcriptional regulator [Pseudoalteromonas luteoviolacea]